MVSQRLVISGLLLTFGFIGWGGPDPAEVHRQEVLAWRAEREQIMRSPDGFLALVGLFELTAGESSFGAGDSSTFRVAGGGSDVPESIGTFRYRDGVTVFTPHEGVSVTDEAGEAVDGPIEMEFEGDSPTKLRQGSISWTVIQRGTASPKERALVPTALNEFLGATFFCARMGRRERGAYRAGIAGVFSDRSRLAIRGGIPGV